MPIYEFRCQACGSVFESLQGLNDPDPERSPCCEAPVARALSVPADHRGRFNAPACGPCGDSTPAGPPCASGAPCCVDH